MIIVTGNVTNLYVFDSVEPEVQDIDKPAKEFARNTVSNLKPTIKTGPIPKPSAADINYRNLPQKDREAIDAMNETFTKLNEDAKKPTKEHEQLRKEYNDDIPPIV